MFQGFLSQSVARSVVILMVDSTDHVTGKTGLTLTITASKNGGALASITPTQTELANGLYSLAFTTGHTDTLGDLVLHITATGADPADYKWTVVTLLTDAAAIKVVTDQLIAAQAEPTAVPAQTATPLAKLGFVFQAVRNKWTVDKATGIRTLYLNDGSTSVGQATDSDSGSSGSYTKNKLA